MSSPESSSSSMAMRGCSTAELQRLVALLLAARQVDVERPGAGTARRSRCARPRPRMRRGQVGGGPTLRQRAPRPARRRARRPAPRWGTASPGTGPAAARCHVGRASTSSPSRVTRATEHLVAGPAHDHVRQRRLAGAVGTHHGVHLARRHREVDAVEDLLAARHAGPQAAGSRACVMPPSTITSSPSTRDVVHRHRPGGRQRTAARRRRGENVLPCFQHSISLSSHSTSPSLTATRRRGCSVSPMA